jgi:hypothetical protein
VQLLSTVKKKLNPCAPHALLFHSSGSGIFLESPFANDQALRVITLDGQYMGVVGPYSVNWTVSMVFWGKTGLTNGDHTIVVTHNDTTSKILVMDAWM